MANIIEHLGNIMGPSVELRKSATHIQWRVAGSGSAWTDLLALSDIQGLPGPGAVPADSAVGGFIGTPGGSATQAAGDERWGLKDSILARGPGIDPTGATESSVAVQALLLAAQATGKELVFPEGAFLINNVKSSKLIHQPRVRGMGQSTTLVGSGGASDFILCLDGVSGRFSGGQIADLQMTNPLGWCLVLRGTIGVQVRRVRMQSSLGGLMFHNFAVQDFTEFCVAYGCYFEAGLVTAIEYRHTAGSSSSFHGSGFRACVINQGETRTTSSIVVGAGCNVYNAPWDGTWWGRAAGVSMIRNDGTNAKVHGHLNFECVAAQTIVDTTSAAAVFYTGTLNRFGGGISRGLRFILADDVSHDGDGGLTAMFAPRQGSFLGAASGVNTIYIENQTMIAAVEINAVGYSYAQLLYISPAAGAGTVTVLSTARSTDTVATGAPAWGIANGRLTVANSKYTAATKIVVGVVSLLGRLTTPIS